MSRAAEGIFVANFLLLSGTGMSRKVSQKIVTRLKLSSCFHNTSLSELNKVHKAVVSEIKAQVSNIADKRYIIFLLDMLKKTRLWTQQNFDIIVASSDLQNLRLSLIILQDADLLTQQNFDIITACTDLENLKFCLCILNSANVLTQASFDIIIEHHEYENFRRVIDYLASRNASLLTPQNLRRIIEIMPLANPDAFVSMLSTVNSASLLTQVNFNRLIHPNNVSFFNTESCQSQWWLLQSFDLTQDGLNDLLVLGFDSWNLIQQLNQRLNELTDQSNQLNQQLNELTDRSNQQNQQLNELMDQSNQLNQLNQQLNLIRRNRVERSEARTLQVLPLNGTDNLNEQQNLQTAINASLNYPQPTNDLSEPLTDRDAVSTQQFLNGELFGDFGLFHENLARYELDTQLAVIRYIQAKFSGTGFDSNEELDAIIDNCDDYEVFQSLKKAVEKITGKQNFSDSDLGPLRQLVLKDLMEFETSLLSKKSNADAAMDTEVISEVISLVDSNNELLSKSNQDTVMVNEALPVTNKNNESLSELKNRLTAHINKTWWSRFNVFKANTDLKVKIMTDLALRIDSAISEKREQSVGDVISDWKTHLCIINAKQQKINAGQFIALHRNIFFSEKRSNVKTSTEDFIDTISSEYKNIRFK